METVQRDELVQFLRLRRSRLKPEDVGLGTDHRRRRTPGLRREEVAQLAEISTTWYTWLEQGREIRVSAEVLESLSRALQLTGSEREYLFSVAGHPPPPPRSADVAEPSASVQHVVEALGATPTYVQDPVWDLLAWNDAACAVFADFGSIPAEERNLMRFVFAPRKRTHGRLLNWADWARFYVGQFRADTARYRDDPRYLELVDGLQANEHFREWWASREVQGREEPEPKQIEHRDAGLLVLECSRFQVEAQPELTLVVHTPAPGTGTAERLEALLRSRARASSAA